MFQSVLVQCEMTFYRYRGPCADPESFVRGVQILRVLGLLVEEWREDPNTL